MNHPVADLYRWSWGSYQTATSRAAWKNFGFNIISNIYNFSSLSLVDGSSAANPTRLYAAGQKSVWVNALSNPADLQVLNIFSQTVVLHLAGCLPLREILVWVLPFLLQPFSLVESLLGSSIGDLDRALSEMGMQMSEERQRRSIVTFFELVWETMSISDQSGTYSCCSGCQGSTCCLYGSASFSCGR